MAKKKVTQKANQQKEIDTMLELMLNESIPTAQSERKKYMSDCAFFYVTIFKRKLEHFKYLQLQELAYLGRDEEFYRVVRCNINCFRLIDEWMEKMTNEHVGNMESIRMSFDETKSDINNLKKTYENKTN